MINERSSEALAFNGVINCGSESPFHHRARHCRNISARPRDALQRSLEGLTRRSKKIAIAELHAIEANSARADRCPPVSWSGGDLSIPGASRSTMKLAMPFPPEPGSV